MNQLPTVVVGDHFIPAEWYVEAITERLGDSYPLTKVGLAGTKREQHAAQHRMEVEGVESITSPPEVLDAAVDAEVLVVHFAPVPADVIAASPNLTAVIVARAGVENVNVDAASQHGVAVINIAGRNASGVAELALGLMLSEGRNIARADRSIRAGEWKKDFGHTPIELGGRTVGMVGFGHVGGILAHRLSGFGCRILVHDPYADPEMIASTGAESVDLTEVFSESDYVSVQARLTAETERFITSEHFDLMKPTSYFINVARSRLVRYDHLYEALASGGIRGAGLDVHDEEPLPETSKWRDLDNVTLTTHFGGDTEETNRRSAGLCADALVELCSTGRATNVINRDAIGWSES